MHAEKSPNSKRASWLKPKSRPAIKSPDELPIKRPKRAVAATKEAINMTFRCPDNAASSGTITIQAIKNELIPPERAAPTVTKIVRFMAEIIWAIAKLPVRQR